MKVISIVLASSFVFAISCFAEDAPALKNISGENYSWKNVPVGGGGAVIGILVHPLAKDVVYMRTDVGGAYRWDEAKQEWIPLQDSIPFTEWNLYGTDSLAVDPSDATGNKLYLSTGKYCNESWAKPNGVIMKSNDRGATWKRVLPESCGHVSGSGEKLAVDPNNGKHLLYASKTKGLMESDDEGETWKQNASFPSQIQNADGSSTVTALLFTVFDKSSGLVPETSHTKTIYVGGAGKGVFCSEDGGASWKLLENSPKDSFRTCIGSDGVLFISHKDGIAKFAAKDGWKDITPPTHKGNYSGIAQDFSNPKHLVAAFLQNKKDPPMFRSTDGGETWTQLKNVLENTVPWWNPDVQNHRLAHVFAMSFDPFHPNRVWAVDWYGVYRADDITAEAVKWTNLEKGHEEIVTLGTLEAPPESKFRLYSSVADVGGFDHESIDSFPTKATFDRGYKWQTTTGIAWSRSDKDFLVRVGGLVWNKPGLGGAYTLDGGETWQLFPKNKLPYKDIARGRVVIAGKGKRIIWTPQTGDPYLSDDLGNSWKKIETPIPLPGAMPGNRIFSYEQPINVDISDCNRIYIYYKQQVLRSDDAGDTWKIVGTKTPDSKIIFTSGVKDDVWIAAKGEGKGLFRSKDAGVTWEQIPATKEARLACAGKNPPGKEHSAIFLCGIVGETQGYFRSDDLGASWIRIDTLPNQRIGNDPNSLCGDWRVFGGVFVGTNGRGIFYGAPVTGK
ncbi:MAG TPA: hypothetical protein DCZ94_18325 [Lentisphaeria bacterium]|nr:MAG: hypothetical protein A2X48_22860 [Lentisphaerae bacterium GWF2_49_21]HBC88903.1 hypothetical protein [Lentisphaeria bacterium]